MMLAGVRLSNGEEEAAARALQVSFAADPHVLLLAPFRWPLAGLLGSRLTREAREDASLEFLSFFRSFPEVAVRMALRRDRWPRFSQRCATRAPECEGDRGADCACRRLDGRRKYTVRRPRPDDW